MVPIEILLPALEIADHKLRFAVGEMVYWRLAYSSSIEGGPWCLSDARQNLEGEKSNARVPRDGSDGAIIEVAPGVEIYLTDRDPSDLRSSESVTLVAPFFVAFGPSQAPDELAPTKIFVNKIRIVSMVHRLREDVWRPISETAEYEDVSSIPDDFGAAAVTSSAPESTEWRADVGVAVTGHVH